MANTRTSAKQKKSENVVAMNGEIADQLETLRADVAQLATTVKDQAQAAITAKADAAKTIAADSAETAKERYQSLTETAETRIKDNPLTSVAIAVGAGLLLGALTRR